MDSALEESDCCLPKTCMAWALVSPWAQQLPLSMIPKKASENKKDGQVYLLMI